MIRSKGWYKWAWDPVEGCQRGCEYCYGKKQFSKLGKDFTNLQFFPERLAEPSEVNPSRIFVNHWSDLMAEWTPREWVRKIIDVCRSLPDHEFVFLTKSPMGYLNFDFPENCILGVTIEYPGEWYRANVMKLIKNRKMCSCEPLLGNFNGYDFSQFEFVVVGKLMGKETNHKYFYKVKHPNIYYKK